MVTVAAFVNFLSQAEDGIRDIGVTGVQTCALPIWVLVGVKSADQVTQGFATIINNARKHDPKAEILGVQIQQMLQGGQEVIIGAVTDPAFGKLVAFGLGGLLVEVLKDITF